MTDAAHLGWDDRRAGEVAPGALVGRVVRQDRGWVRVAPLDAEDPRLDPDEHGIVAARTREDRVGTPVVGDWVVLDDEPDDLEIGDVLERRNRLRRADPVGEGEQVLAANLGRVAIVVGLDRPIKDGRIQRGLIQTHDADATPLLVVTKADLGGGDELVDSLRTRHPGIEVVAVSAYDGSGIASLLDRLETGTTVLLGESGAGKSSLLNALGGADVAEIGALRSRDNKGRHTTTRRELYRLPAGGMVVDTPGLRGLGVCADPEAVDAAFADVAAAVDCRFADCGHEREPGCGVRAAVERGDLAAERVAAYLDLRAEAVSSQETGWRR